MIAIAGKVAQKQVLVFDLVQITWVSSYEDLDSIRKSADAKMTNFTMECQPPQFVKKYDPVKRMNKQDRDKNASSYR